MRNEFRSLISSKFLPLRSADQLRDDDNLVDLGVLDSLAFAELVEELETRYRIGIRDIEITEANFASVTAIVKYLKNKLAR